MMARREQQSEQGCHRPRRNLAKSSDDNVLGISWKEEQELRKAMYVSLRDQQQSNAEANTCERLRSLRSSSSSMTRITSPKKLRSNIVKSRSAVDNKHARKNYRSMPLVEDVNLTETDLRTKFQKKELLNSLPVSGDKASIKSAFVENQSDRVKIPQNTSRIRLRDLPNRRSLVRISDVDNQMGDANSTNRKASGSSRAYEGSGGISSIASPGCSRRRTSITASNNANSDYCSTNISRRKNVGKRNSCSSPIGKESFKSESIDKYATCSSPKKSRTQTLKVKRRSLVAAVSPVIPAKELNDSASKCVSNGDCHRDFQMFLKSHDNFPSEVWQDHTGQPPLVSDFIKFLCNYDYEDPCNPNKEWFNKLYIFHGKSLQRASQSSQPSSKSSKRGQLNSNIVNSTTNITVGTSQQTKSPASVRTSGLRIAKKFAYVQQPRNTCSVHRPISAFLKSDVIDNKPRTKHPSTTQLCNRLRRKLN
uniref:Uncharacterized protein n=2 Tax=Trichobilharzia regenti TaxID=157069 RepID=A0AA85IT34_TRIRE|nr:unnamed protein product [Trichobilharzia regenti]